MKTKIINLIAQHNHDEKGIHTIDNIEEYVDKLMNNAIVIPFFEQNILKGMIAYYANDPAKEKAFLSLILIAEEFQKESIGSNLIDLSIKNLSKKGFAFYQLEVLKSNQNAIEFYKKKGFEISQEKELFWCMTKKL